MPDSLEDDPHPTMLRGMDGLVAALEVGYATRSVLEPPAEDGARPAVARCSVEGPSDAELELVQARARARAALFDEVAPGVRIGRYVLLHELGRGGMGIVHAAYDPELDRKIAIKLLPGSSSHRDPEDARRLAREAQALARLAHPHVIAVHDVGLVSPVVESDAGEPVAFVAMEYVDGPTLRGWLAEAPRSVREVLAMLEQAGRGLAAAHALGLVHRDFKPDNVMVGKDGRARVMDFGLARALESGRTSGGAPAIGGVLPAPPHDTATGSILGTPAYMAPEQHEGRADARSDQFAFCVTLWEALCGERPFSGNSRERILVEILAGRLRPVPRGRRVPSWLRRACERGLSAVPAQRWPSMHELLSTLATGRTRARVHAGLAAVGVVAMLGAGVEAHRRWDLARRSAACEATGDEIQAAWSPAREQALREGLLATGTRDAPAAADRVVPWLERQAEGWREARVEACLDADVRGTWNADVLERSLWCLDKQRMQLESLVDELTHADASVMSKAVTAAARLQPAGACRDEAGLRTLDPPAPEDREALRVVRAEVAWAGNLEQLGRYDEGLDRARHALTKADALGKSALSAMARLQLGVLLHRKGMYAEAETTLEDAYFAAVEASAFDIAFPAAIELADTLIDASTRHADVARWGRHAAVALAEIHDPEGLRRATLLIQRAHLHVRMGELRQARDLFEQATDLHVAALGEHHPRVAASLTHLGNVQRALGSYDEARVAYERALGIVEEVLGAHHPNVAAVLSSLANLHTITGDVDRAEPLQARALATLEAALGPDHPSVATALGNLAGIHESQGDHEGASALYVRALAIREQTLGRDHPDVAGNLHNLAVVRVASGDLDEAEALEERAITILELELPPDHPDLARSLENLANLHYARGRHAEALPLYERAAAITERAHGPAHAELARPLGNLASACLRTGAVERAQQLYERALAIREHAVGPDDPKLAYILDGLAEVALARRRASEAIAPARRAVALADAAQAPRELLAESRFVLARALWEAPEGLGRDRMQATALATQALDGYRAAGKGSTARLAEVEVWLAEHAEADR